MSSYFLIGLNHKTAPVALREEFLQVLGSPDDCLEMMTRDLGWDECVFLSTCNRVELYGINDDKKQLFFDFLNSKCGSHFSAHLYEISGLKCVEHLFRVAASLDSMVVGEPQILGQVKDAYILAREKGVCRSHLVKLFEKALHVAKKVRSETEISLRPVSIGSVGVDLALKVFGDLADKKLLVMGAGEMAEQVYRSALDAGVTSIDLANRTKENAETLIAGSGSNAYDLTEMPVLLETADLLLTSVSVDHPVISADFIKKVMKARKNRPLFMIDLGLPRNVEQAVNDIANVYLYNIDDLVGACEINKNIRGDEAIRACEILEKEASAFYSFVLHKNPTIQMLGRKLDSIREVELDKTLRQLAHLTERDKKIIATLSESLVNKILHDPVIHLKSGDNAELDHRVHDMVRRLFRLDES